MKMSTTALVLILLSCTLHLSTSTNRRVLHQPFFPLNSISPAPSPSPHLPQQPKFPASSTPPSKQPSNLRFFPSVSPPPLPPARVPPTETSFPTTLPANISSVVVPRAPSSSSHKPFSAKLIAVAATLGSITFLSLIALLVVHYTRRSPTAAGKAARSNSLRLYPANAPSPDRGAGGSRRPPPPRGGSSAASSAEFLYLGTVGDLRGDVHVNNTTDGRASTVSVYQKLGSPELCPLPPLPRQNFQWDDLKAAAESSPPASSSSNQGVDRYDEEEFYSPAGSPGSKERSFRGVETEGFCDGNFKCSYSSNSSSPTHSTSNNSTSPPLNSSPRSSNSNSPDSVIKFPAPRISDVSHQSSNGPYPERIEILSSGKGFQAEAPPPPPPPPPIAPAPKPISGPPVLITPTRPTVLQNVAPLVSPTGHTQNSGTSDDTPKPKLKPLHWDKVRASSDRAMVWDQLKSSSFK